MALKFLGLIFVCDYLPYCIFMWSVMKWNSFFPESVFFTKVNLLESQKYQLTAKPSVKFYLKHYYI